MDSTILPGALLDLAAGLMPYSITVIRRIIWIDHEMGGLLKDDLTFEADIRKPVVTTPSGYGEGKPYNLFHQIGAETVNSPIDRCGLASRGLHSRDGLFQKG